MFLGSQTIAQGSGLFTLLSLCDLVSGLTDGAQASKWPHRGQRVRTQELNGLVGIWVFIPLLLSMRHVLGIDLANPSSPLGSAPLSGFLGGGGRLVFGVGSLSSGLGRLPPGPFFNYGGGSAQPTYPLKASEAVGPSGLSSLAGDGWQGEARARSARPTGGY